MVRDMATSTMDPMTYQSFQSVSLTIVCR